MLELARWSTTHRKYVLLGWIVLLLVFLDALVVRCLLLPAVLSIIGQRTWQLPAWLDRLLPRLNIEGTASVGEHAVGTPHSSRPARGEVATEGADG